MISVKKRFLKWPLQILRMEYEINNHFRLKHFTPEDSAITFHPGNGIRLQNYTVLDLRIPQHILQKLYYHATCTFYRCVTVVLQVCYRCVTGVLQVCYRCVTMHR
jgi:hypothetical protein